MLDNLGDEILAYFRERQAELTKEYEEWQENWTSTSTTGITPGWALQQAYQFVKELERLDRWIDWLAVREEKGQA